jgi:endonuclease/exonuclease/phosphatase family metal-dependent hydrolase
MIALAVLGGCVRNHAVIPRPPSAGALDLDPPVTWFGPELPADTGALGRWRKSVGPPVVVADGPEAPLADRLVVVNWNMNVGAGNVPQLFMELTRQVGPGVPIVFLLQEAFRSGSDVPGAIEPGATFARRILGVGADGRREEIQALAAGLGLHAYYVPSMRNGGPLTSVEDRGNAILSTAPLDDLSAIELPFERQRRVAVGATVSGRAGDGAPWRLRVVSAHLDNMAGASRLWIAGSEFARTRQARGLVAALGRDAPVVLGADLNTLFGFSDSAYLEAARAFPDTHVTDRRTTFRGLLRLDHLFFRLDDGWTATFHRAESSYGSDHYPLIGMVVFR